MTRSGYPPSVVETCTLWLVREPFLAAAVALLAVTLRSYSIVTSTLALLVSLYALYVAGKANRTVQKKARAEVEAIEAEGLVEDLDPGAG